MKVDMCEFSRHVLGYEDAHMSELNPDTTHPMIHLMLEQDGVEDIGGTLRLGSYPCILDKSTKAYELYGKETIHERHRHRYEVNNTYVPQFEASGMVISACTQEEHLPEMMELPNHPCFFGVQFHPEFTSTPRFGHPLFKAFIRAALNYRETAK